MSCEHYIEMMQYALDAAENEKPWELWEFTEETGNWLTLGGHPSWHKDTLYRRRRPFARFIMINGREVPEPLRHVPPIGTKYYVVFIQCELGMAYRVWVGDHIDKALLQDGLIHLVKEHAEIHSEALLSFTKKE